MEVIALETLVEMAVTEVLHVILASKCCGASKRKWRKIMGKVEATKEDRTERIKEQLKTLTPSERASILDYATKITSV
tara:strand:+ start:507 stop:740 length:234 start_codon:yes stop_codon:yes gene_type:complete